MSAKGPAYYQQYRHDPQYQVARLEHARRLRDEKLTLREIGSRLGVSGTRAQQLIIKARRQGR